MSRKLLTLIQREFKAIVFRKVFVISTILMPVFMGMIFLLPIYIADLNRDAVKLEILDETQTLEASLRTAFADKQLDNGDPKYLINFIESDESSLEEAKNRVRDKKVAGLLVLPKDLLQSNQAQLFLRSLTRIELQREIARTITAYLRSTRLADSGLDMAVISSVLAPVEMETESVLTGKGDPRAQFILAFAVAMLLYMTLLIYGGQIMNAVIEDKTSKVYEVVHSCASAREILLGKVLGVAGAALTQMLFWGFFLLWLNSQFEIPQLQMVNFRDGFVFQFIPLFILGFLIYAFAFSAIGSVAQTSQEGQQLQTPLVLFVMIPLMLIYPLSNDPDGFLAVFFSLFPMSAPMVMPMRLGVTTPDLWQILACYVLLITTVIAVYFLSGKIFEVAIMYQGKRPSWKMIAQWVRG